MVLFRNTMLFLCYLHTENSEKDILKNKTSVLRNFNLYDIVLSFDTSFLILRELVKVVIVEVTKFLFSVIISVQLIIFKNTNSLCNFEKTYTVQVSQSHMWICSKK